MKTKRDMLTILKGELEFLDHGGYRTPIGRRQPLFCMESAPDWTKPEFFEDSPSCPKEHYDACNPRRGCTLLAFVPKELRTETVPCRHIPLNETGETIESLEKSGYREKVEPTLRSWLLTNIEKLEKVAVH
jgi:hypothetical protein